MSARDSKLRLANGVGWDIAHMRHVNPKGRVFAEYVPPARRGIYALADLRRVGSLRG